MSGQQSYIVRLLRHVESSLMGPGIETIRTRLGKIVQKISRADDLPGALETLYAVEGCDTMALRLMWITERPAPPPAVLENEVMDYEVRQMAWILRPVAAPERAQLPPAAERPLDRFYEALHRFGKSVDALRRGSGAGDRGPESDRLYGLLNDCATLQAAAETLGHGRVVRFCEAFSRFVHYGIEEHRSPDRRILNILENANVTLQTVLESASPEEDDALENMIALLNDPRRLLE